jgi:hypothetical protein
MVGAVGIGNDTDRNIKDLEEMMGSAKALIRNIRESKGILIGPSMAPRFFAIEIASRAVLATRKLMSVSGQNFAARMANRRPKTLNKRDSSVYEVWVEHSAMARMPEVWGSGGLAPPTRPKTEGGDGHNSYREAANRFSPRSQAIISR